MHRTIGYLSKRFARIRPGEGRKVLLTFLYFFLIITAYYVIKAGSRSLVLDQIGFRMVPYMDLIVAGVIGSVITLFTRLVDRVSKPQLVGGAFAASTGIMVLFWFLLTHVAAAWVAAALYVWVSIFSVLAVTLFWLVANDLYRPRDAKRLFGFIGTGGIIGGITGSSIAALGAHILGTDQLLLLTAALLVCSWFVVQWLWRVAGTEAPLEGRPTLASPRHETFLSNVKQFFQLITSSRYLMLLMAIVGLNKMITTLVNYQMNAYIATAFPTADAKTVFLGLFNGGINALAFVVQFFCTSWVLRRWGLLAALLVMPVGLLAGSTALLLVPVFWVAAGTELYDRALDYSLNNTAKEVLYLPIDRSIRYKVKPFIDMVVFRFGKGIAAIAGLAVITWGGLSPRWLGLLTLPLLGVWVTVAFRVRREYTMTIRTVLQARASRRRSSADGTMVDDLAGMLSTLTGARATHVRMQLAARLVEPANGHAKELLDGLASYEEAAPPRLDARFEAEQLHATIQDRDNPAAVRRHAVRLLARQANQDAMDYLCGMLIVEEEAVLRDEVLRELVKIRLAHRALQFPVPLLRRQVEREVRQHGRVVQVAGVYRQQLRGRVVPDDPVLGLLKALLEESVEQTFRLLMLLYRPEDIHLVYEQMRAPDTHVRADAIELLDNLLDPAMRHAVFPILDEDGFLSAVDGEVPPAAHDPAAAYRVLQEAIWDANCWLSVTTLCAVGRLRLTTMRQELERAVHHTKPLVACAAKAALCIAPLL